MAALYCILLCWHINVLGPTFMYCAHVHVWYSMCNVSLLPSLAYHYQWYYIKKALSSSEMFIYFWWQLRNWENVWCIKILCLFQREPLLVYFSWWLETRITSNALQDNIDIDTGPYFCLNLQKSCLNLTKSFCENHLILKWKTVEKFLSKVRKICWCCE